jgi:hypothetical protein
MALRHVIDRLFNAEEDRKTAEERKERLRLLSENKTALVQTLLGFMSEDDLFSLVGHAHAPHTAVPPVEVDSSGFSAQ